MSGRQQALRRVPLKYSYTSDILHHNLGGDVGKEPCGPKTKVFVSNLHGTNEKHANK